MSKNILIIENDADILDIMIYILKDEGYKVHGSTNCLTINEVLLADPDLILMDNWLTDGLGGNECRKLKEDAATCHIPVVLVSASQHLAILAHESLADGYFAKPFDLKELVAIVKQYTNG